MHTDTHKDIAVRSLHAMAADSPDAFDGLIHPEATNREAIHEPPACRGRGTAAFEATARWLQEAWSDIAFTVEECIAQDDLVATHGTMSGRHTGPFTVFTPEGQVAQVLPPTGRRFHVNHAHFFRLRDGLVVEHWAVRDDRALAEQLGWAPPTPLYALRMTLATRSARRTHVNEAREHGRRRATEPLRRPSEAQLESHGHNAAMDIARSIALFVVAAIAEIGGAWLVWQGIREDRGWIWIGAGVIALGLYGFVATLQPDANFGRILAAYGGVFVAGSLLWGMAMDGFRPDRYDVIGALVCLAGVAVIMYAPRTA